MTDDVRIAPPDRSDLIDKAWRVLLGGALCMFCAQAAMILFTFGIFSPEIIADTGWSAVRIAGAIGPGAMMGALLAPLVGRAADRFGPRKLVILGAPIYAAGFALLGYAPTTPTMFAICLGIACAVGFVGIPVFYAQIASGWFARRRGLALSLLFTAVSVGVGFWSIYSSMLLANLGWRHAYAVMGATAGAIVLGAGLFLLRDPPARSKDPQAPASQGVTVGEAIRSLTFWKVAVTFALLTGILAGCTVTLPTVLRGMGVTPAFAASVIPVVGIGMFIGRLSAGVMLDRWFSPFVTASFVTFSFMGMTLMLFAPSSEVFFLAAGLLGLGLGAEMDAAAYMVSRGFGLRAFGTIYGLVTLGYGVSGAIGTGIVGVAMASGVRSVTIFTIGACILVTVVLLLLSIRPRHLPFEVTSQ